MHPGDDGNTHLGNGRRVAKDDPHLEVLGALEELQATLALCRSLALPSNTHWAELDAMLRMAVEDVHDLCLVVSLQPDPAADPDNAPRSHTFPLEALDHLERVRARCEEIAPPRTEVLLPGANELTARCALARAQCRRVERRAVTLARQRRLSGNVLRYLNRLGDLLFLIPLASGQDPANQEVWRPREERDPPPA